MEAAGRCADRSGGDRDFEVNILPANGRECGFHHRGAEDAERKRICPRKDAKRGRNFSHECTRMCTKRTTEAEAKPIPRGHAETRRGKEFAREWTRREEEVLATNVHECARIGLRKQRQSRFPRRDAETRRGKEFARELTRKCANGSEEYFGRKFVSRAI